MGRYGGCASSRLRMGLLCGAAAMLIAGQALAKDAQVAFNIPAQDAGAALNDFSRQSGMRVLFPYDAVAGKHAPAVSGTMSADEALAPLLRASGLVVVANDNKTITLGGASGASPTQDNNVVQELVVTAQKKEEAIQTVPIAISAFTQKTLEEQHIEGGFDLLKAIPNVTFSKNNFTSYNFSIRGIGTKAVSATTDPGVSVSFNNIGLIQNRLFEQEYFDIERVEVLRGPQGTLYGRNATAGVINVISAKPTDHFEGSLKAEVGNYNSRRASGMLNIPIIGDKLDVRLAGSFTQRDGYDYNSVTQNRVNGRNLWSGRLTIGFKPFERLHGNFIWEHFDENDNRSRTGKQLCHRDPGKTSIDGVPVNVSPFNGANDIPYWNTLMPAIFSQGCLPGSLYDASAFGTPNGLALPFVFANLGLGSDCGPGCSTSFYLGFNRDSQARALLQLADPYGGMMQSRDLRTIASFRDPKYRAKADLLELNIDFDLTDTLSVHSQTAYDNDSVYSFQDYNRFNTLPVFNDTTQLTACPINQDWCTPAPTPWANLTPGGVFCDPQLGCSNTLAGFDISQARARQFTQELRIQSDSNSSLNFSAGADYTTFDALVDYYVFYNLITAFAMTRPFNNVVNGINPALCSGSNFFLGGPPISTSDPNSPCPYIDPNPIESINGQGHNYFRSKNPYKLKSGAMFGELYWTLGDFKVTSGLRLTDDNKTFIPVPSQILLAPSIVAGGTTSIGYPELPAIKQHWRELTGRFTLDWKPHLSFTDATLLYASYSRGYKGGGANPPKPGFATVDDIAPRLLALGDSQAVIDTLTQRGILPILKLNAAEYSDTFKPEFVNAFEFGSKNTLLGGALVLNGDAFFYDYKDYQVSQIRDRTAVNENFDATIWGLEYEAVFSPSRNLRLIANLGYLDTAIAKGMTSIDIMNRTQSDPAYVVVKPFVQLPSNCVVPIGVAANFFRNKQGGYSRICGGVGGLIGGNNPTPPIDPATGAIYDVRNYPQLNGGAGIKAQLGGNELPNAPHWTMNIGAQQSWDILEGWKATLRGDAYWQSQSWARVYNDDPYDKLHGWYNVNLSLWFEKPETGLKIEIYAKNLLDKSPITDAFLNSDDSALTTNVFTLDPRLIGFSITKTF